MNIPIRRTRIEFDQVFIESNPMTKSSCRYYTLFIKSSLTFMVNRRGQTSLIFEDNIFHINRRYEGTTFWQCLEYKRYKCKCRCITTKGTVKRSKTEHNHPANTAKIKQKCLTMKCAQPDFE